MQSQIDSLQRQIDDLRKGNTNKDMDVDRREIMRNEVIKEVNGNGVPTTTVTVSPGDQITFPNPTKLKTIILKWKGKEFKVPYFD